MGMGRFQDSKKNQKRKEARCNIFGILAFAPWLVLEVKASRLLYRHRIAFNHVLAEV